MRHLSLAVLAVAVLSACDATSPTSPTSRAPTANKPDESSILNLLPLSPKYNYGTSAAALVANALGLSVKAGTAGPTGPGGGSESNTAITAVLPKILLTNVLNGEVWANKYHAYAASSVDKLYLNLVGIEISASVLASKALSGCTAIPVGSSSIASLTINGKQIAITGEPNQTIPLLLGKIVINEQLPFSKDGIRVRALHIVIYGIADIAVAESAAPLYTC